MWETELMGVDFPVTSMLEAFLLTTESAFDSFSGMPPLSLAWPRTATATSFQCSLWAILSWEEEMGSSTVIVLSHMQYYQCSWAALLIQLYSVQVQETIYANALSQFCFSAFWFICAECDSLCISSSPLDYLNNLYFALSSFDEVVWYLLQYYNFIFSGREVWE